LIVVFEYNTRAD